MYLQTLANMFCSRLETVAAAYRPLQGEDVALRGMKFGAVASSKGLSFARTFFGIAEPNRNPVAAQNSRGQRVGTEEDENEENRGVDSRAGAIARLDVTHPESGWVNQRPPRAEDRVVDTAASDISL